MRRMITSDVQRDFHGTVLSCRKTVPYWERVSQFFAIVIFSVFPLIIGRETYFDITQVRFRWLRYLTTAYLAVCLLLLIWFVVNGNARRDRLAAGGQKLTVSQILLLLYLLWAVVSALLSPYRADTWYGQGRYEGLLTILLYASLYFFLSFWGEYTDKYVYGLSIMAIIMGVMCIFQPLGVDFLTPEGVEFWDVKFFGTIGNVDCVSGFAAMVIPPLLCGFILWENRWRSVCLRGYILLFYVLLIVDADSGKVGLLVALAVMLPFLLSQWKRAARTITAMGTLLMTYAVKAFFPVTEEGALFAMEKKTVAVLLLGAILVIGGLVMERWEGSFRWSEKAIRRVITLFMVVVLLAGLIFVYAYSGNQPLLSDIHQVLHGQWSYDLGTRRGALWELSLRFIKDHPLFGTGPDTFASLAKPYFDSGYLIERPDSAHNDFLQIGVCLGLGGLLLYVGWVLSLVVRLLKKAPENPLLLIFGGAMAGYLGHVFFSFSVVLITPLFWAFAGLADKCMRQMPEKRAARVKTTEEEMDEVEEETEQEA